MATLSTLPASAVAGANHSPVAVANHETISKTLRLAPRAGVRHRIVIIGGGAGGLELATQLGNRLRYDDATEVVLVDQSPTHLWKPLLHEVAAGTLDPNAHQLDFVAQARWHHFEFQQGALLGLQSQRRCITLAALQDADGVEILPPRELPYQTLILAIGSVTNFFNTRGASEHAIAIDSTLQAERFQQRLLAACMRAQYRFHTQPQVNLVIIGAGATGVELAAELRNAAQVMRAYGVHQLDPCTSVTITLIDSGPRILGPLSDTVARETAELLTRMKIDILTGERVTEVQADAVLTASGKYLPADLTVWAAGIKISPLLAELGLPVNKLGQVLVERTLQVQNQADIFAFGDCASCPWPEHPTTVPPRAQAAHQQARFLTRALRRRLAGQALPRFQFHDRGSLLSLGRYQAIGTLTTRARTGNLTVHGLVARLLYTSLYRMHLLALHGVLRTLVETLAQWLRGQTAPRVKLH